MLRYLPVIAAALQLCNAQFSISGADLFIGGSTPIVDTGYAKFQGKQDLLTQSDNYLGITYASAPRFDHSILANQTLRGIQNVSDYGPACPQHDFVSLFAPSDFGLGALAGTLEAALSPVFQQSEECLSINVQRPQNVTENSKLPVLMWIHGGGFESGASASFAGETTIAPGVFYQGANLVKRSIDMDQPMIVVSINYRLMHFGFTASQEFEEAGLLNLGLEDQRNAMRWVQQNIAAFGGDPDRVTIMGESAGSWAVTAHLVANGGDNEGLFHGAVGISGGPVKVEGPGRQQGMFDDMVNYVGCGNATDKIACLRMAPYDLIYAHAQTVNFLLGYRSLASAWTIRPDGKFLTESPDKLVAEGKIANVPVMYGDMRDEGTLFSLINSLNTTTTEEVIDYFSTYWWPNVTQAQMDKLMELYPEDPSAGSPFGTGVLNQLGPQFKRIAALTGDYSFQCQRRQLLDKITAPKWNYLIEQAVPLPLIDETPLGEIIAETGVTGIPVLGSFHVSDVVLNWFGTLPASVSQNSYHLMGVLVSFVNHLDPNQHGMASVPTWPEYNSTSRETIRWQESGVDVIVDDYRQEQMNYLNEIGDYLRI
ncbi:carboxylic ester hydrolase-37 [Coleophoma cylindrospora]|uniref:Carboxylic ester hydrolase n=1 Tax=Coleophoma cylindrospora TaxID=1849047 RepID=A0A3D8QFY1_9HELO|nr:carboxylic ester hydrolase-37 [Coleophoma cylindrospora]